MNCAGCGDEPEIAATMELYIDGETSQIMICFDCHIEAILHLNHSALRVIQRYEKDLGIEQDEVPSGPVLVK